MGPGPPAGAPEGIGLKGPPSGGRSGLQGPKEDVWSTGWGGSGWSGAPVLRGRRKREDWARWQVRDYPPEARST